MSRLAEFDDGTTCDTAKCLARAVIFETVNGAEYVWCPECFQELERDRANARALIATLKKMAGV